MIFGGFAQDDGGFSFGEVGGQTEKTRGPLALLGMTAQKKQKSRNKIAAGPSICFCIDSSRHRRRDDIRRLRSG